MPLVILVVDLGLHSMVVDDNRTEENLSLTRVKGPTTGFNLIKQLLPHINIISQLLVDVRSLRVPKCLVA